MITTLYFCKSKAHLFYFYLGVINAQVRKTTGQNIYSKKRTNRVKTPTEPREEVELERKIERLEVERLEAEDPKVEKLEAKGPKVNSSAGTREKARPGPEQKARREEKPILIV